MSPASGLSMKPSSQDQANSEERTSETKTIELCLCKWPAWLHSIVLRRVSGQNAFQGRLFQRFTVFALHKDAFHGGLIALCPWQRDQGCFVSASYIRQMGWGQPPCANGQARVKQQERTRGVDVQQERHDVTVSDERLRRYEEESADAELWIQREVGGYFAPEWSVREYYSGL